FARSSRACVRGTTTQFSWSTAHIALYRRGRYLWTYRWRIRLGNFDILKLVKPLISATLCLLRLGSRGGLWWIAGTAASRTRWFIRYGRGIFRRQFFFSGFLRAFGASYFFSICRLKPLAA